MNILHYSLGIYPDRQGGLVRYSTDLAIKLAENNIIYYLFPGKLGIVDKKVKIVKAGNYKNFCIYRIENALPIPLFAGITDVDMYTKATDQGVYEKFLKEQHIEIVHIHSLMGLHIEFVKAARKLNIPVFMTTHDFFGLCPITTLYKNGSVCEEKQIGTPCFNCSQRAHSYYKLAVGQSKLYKKLKSTSLVTSLRKDVLLQKQENSQLFKNYYNIDDYPDYEKLNWYYRECFSLIEYFLFNSNQTREVFERRLGHLPGKTIPLLLPTITDKRKKRKFLKDNILHVGFMGEPTEFKGYYILKSAVEEVAREGYKVELDVYSNNVVANEIVKKKGTYTADKLDQIYDFLDIVVVPSIWYETLSFIALEAIAGGMPCLISDHVGAKDLIENHKSGFVVAAGDEQQLSHCLFMIMQNPMTLESINQRIIDNDYDFDFEKHCSIVEQEYVAHKKRYR